MLKAVQQSVKIQHSPKGKQVIVSRSNQKEMQKLASALKEPKNKYMRDGYFEIGEK